MTVAMAASIIPSIYHLSAGNHLRFHHQSRKIPTLVVRSSFTPATDRAIAAVAYTLPLINSIKYGSFILATYPSLATLLSPIMPALAVYRSLPGGSLLVFFGLYLGVGRNSSFNPYVRFNVMQALYLDILLVIPMLISRILSPESYGELGFTIMRQGYNVVFLFTLGCFLYGFIYSILGKTPYIPFVADAAARQIW